MFYEVTFSLIARYSMQMKSIVISVIFIAAAFQAMAQEGSFIDVYGYAHYATIKNNYDIYYGRYRGFGYAYEHPSTISYGTSLYYTKMFEGYTGIRTGFSFANYAQNASSKVEIADFDSISYDSRLNIQQLAVPVMVNFAINSGGTNDKVFFNMSFGFQLNYLTGANFSLTTNRNYIPTTSFEFKDYFHRLGASYLLGLELKMALGKKERSYLLFGVQYDKTIGGIEKKGIDFTQDTPKELIFPLGILKDYNYDLPNDRANSKTKNESLALKLGLSIRLSK